MTEIADVTDMLSGFEQHNSCRITMAVSVVVVNGVPDLEIHAYAARVGESEAGADFLGSVRVSCRTMNLKRWNSALIHVLYALDFQLALNELGHAEPKRA
jgi:hypothetical protein